MRDSLKGVLIKLHSGDLVKQFREKKGYSQRQLADKVGIRHPMISYWEGNRSFPSDNLALLVADELNIPERELIDLLIIDKNNAQIKIQTTKSNRLVERIEKKKINFPNISTSNESFNVAQLIKVPILGTVPAGPLQEVLPMMRSDAIEYEYLDTNGISNPELVFGLHVSGESMIGKDIKDGDIIIIDTGIQPDNGDVVVAMVNDEATVKTIIKHDDLLILQSANDNIQPIILRSNDLDHIRIIGKVIRIIKKL